MRETVPPAPTADATTDELVLATDLYARCREVDPALAIAEIVACLNSARRDGFAAGLEERADEAHLAGYREGVTAGAAASRAVFEALFAGDPDTPCRTTYRREPGEWLPGSMVPAVECVEVPLDELRLAFDEAERVERGDA